MPYTGNTRIKIEKSKNSVKYIPQVEYVYPILGLCTWEDFEDIYFRTGIGRNRSACRLAFLKARGEDGHTWSKSVIDNYHKFLDDIEYKVEVIYEKYPPE